MRFLFFIFVLFFVQFLRPPDVNRGTLEVPAGHIGTVRGRRGGCEIEKEDGEFPNIWASRHLGVQTPRQPGVQASKRDGI